MIWMPTGMLSTLSIDIVTLGASINEESKLKIGSPVGLGDSAAPSLSPNHFGAGLGQDRVTIASAKGAQFLCASLI